MFTSQSGQRHLPIQAISRPWLLGFAWIAMLLMSRLPQIVLKEFFALETSFVWFWLAGAVTALLMTYLWPALCALRGYLLIMACMAVLTGPLDMLLRGSPLWTTWFNEEQGWVIHFLGERLPLVVEALILIVILIGMGMRRQDFFLNVGKLRAEVVGLRLPGKSNSWLLVGLLLALLLTLLFFVGTAVMTGTPISALSGVLHLLPAILLFALMNAFGEEFVYRAAPLAQLWQAVGARQAIWLTSVWFGLGHFYGGFPSGAVGVLFAGGIALLYGKAMVETRGMLLPVLMHLLTDVAIYLFLALAVQRL